MSNFDSQAYADWPGREVIDSKGEKLGKVSQIYLDEQTAQPTWLSIKSGLFGSRSSFVPLDGANWDEGTLVVAYDKDTVKGAPDIDDSGALSVDEEQELFAHYGWDYDAPESVEEDRATGTGIGADDAMTRSEERLTVGTARQEVGRARLRKYVVTEQVQTTVPVSHEEVRVEREPITAENYDTAVSGPDISEAEHEVVLTAERPVVQKEVVPVERVRLATDNVTEQAEINEEVRKERIEAEGANEGRRGQPGP